MRPVWDKGSPELIAKIAGHLGSKLYIAHSGDQRRRPLNLCATKDVGRSSAEIHSGRWSARMRRPWLRRAITDEGRNLVGDKKARVDENKYEQSTDRIWKCLGKDGQQRQRSEGRQVGWGGGLPELRDGQSLLVFQGAVPAMRGSKQARLRRLHSKRESTLLRWQEIWQ